jgi:hypothetical protein
LTLFANHAHYLMLKYMHMKFLQFSQTLASFAKLRNTHIEKLIFKVFKSMTCNSLLSKKTVLQCTITKSKFHYTYACCAKWAIWLCIFIYSFYNHIITPNRYYCDFFTYFNQLFAFSLGS